MYERKIKNPDGSANLVDDEHGMQFVRDGMFALHVEESTAYERVSRTYQEYEKCTLDGLRYMPALPPFVALRKNFSYHEVVKVG